MLNTFRSAVKRAFGGGNDTPAAPPVARAIPLWKAAHPLTPEHEYRTLIDRGYRRNVVVYSCINQIASSVAQPKIVIKDQAGKEGNENSQILRLFRRPNPEQSKYAFLEGLVTNLQAAGNAYIHKVRNKQGMPVQIWNLRTDRVRIKPGVDGYVEFFEYRLNDIVQLIPAADVIHIKLHDPLEDYYGLSPLVVAARAVDLDDQTLDYLRAFFVNGAAPAGILTMKEPQEPDERERIRRLWREMYGSQRGWHDIAVLDGNAEYQEIGSRPEKLRMDALWGVTETRICAAFGVPPIIVQLATGLARSTFSNYREAVKAMWSETLVPMYTRIAEALTFGLANEFAGEYDIEFDLSNVEVLQEGLAERRDAAVAGWSAGLLNRNQAYVLWGLPEVPGGDKEFASGGGGGFPGDPNAPPGLPGKGFPPGKGKGKPTDDEEVEDEDAETGDPPPFGRRSKKKKQQRAGKEQDALDDEFEFTVEVPEAFLELVENLTN